MQGMVVGGVTGGGAVRTEYSATDIPGSRCSGGDRTPIGGGLAVPGRRIKRGGERAGRGVYAAGYTVYIT